MTLLKRQDGYLNRQVILFRLQYEIHSLQMHPKSPCRSDIALTPKLLERQYALRLVVVPCRYSTSPSPLFQPISLYPPSHISYVAVPHLLRRRIHPCFPKSPPLCSYASVFTAELVCHPYIPCLCYGPYRIIFHRSVYFVAVVCLPSPVGYSPRSASFYTTLLNLLLSKLILLLYALIFSLHFYFLFWHVSSISS